MVEQNNQDLTSKIAWRIVVYGVAVSGLIYVASTLIDQLSFGFHHIHIHFSDAAIVGIPLIIGLTLLYLSSLLSRRKRMAWIVTTALYVAILVFNIFGGAHARPGHHFFADKLIRGFVLPILMLIALILARKRFTVRSDIQNFRQTLPVILIILAVTFVYGTTGFVLMDDHDFHHEIGVAEAMHRTVDQFDLTTNKPLVAYSHRARVFVDSLSVISIGALTYTVILLFQPIKVRVIDQSYNRRQMQKLLVDHAADSEDFFKLWPHDKLYYLGDHSALGYNVRRGVALSIGDPAGKPPNVNSLLDNFLHLCEQNDWLPAFIHTKSEYTKVYKHHGLKSQKIGEEAVLDLAEFEHSVAGGKYFRQIRNRFSKLGYTVEVLPPPHSHAILRQLKAVSDDWLSRPGRVERGFVMGYFSSDYLQQCNVMVARDDKGTIKAFLNQVPTLIEAEANYDLLRQRDDSPGNINDYLLLNFIDYIREQGFKHLNLGLCPLAGMDKEDAESILDNAMRFVYANGDRFYSFSGLYKFKSKYEPNWSPRYITYQGGIREFARVISSLNRAMKVRKFIPD